MRIFVARRFGCCLDLDLGLVEISWHTFWSVVCCGWVEVLSVLICLATSFDVVSYFRVLPRLDLSFNKTIDDFISPVFELVRSICEIWIVVEVFAIR